MKNRIYAERRDFNFRVYEQYEGYNACNWSGTSRRNTSTGVNNDFNNKCEVSPNRIIDIPVTITRRHAL